MTDTHHAVADEPSASRLSGLVAPLRDVGRGDLERAGGKGANLGELVRRGFPVPDGFIVTTDAYAEIVAYHGLAAVIAERLADGGSDGAAIRADITGVTVPPALRSAIVDAYRELGDGPVAVRSSATAEDLPGAAFAGQQDTYLNVSGADAVLDAVRSCWASLWTERAIAYRHNRGIDSGDIRIAVVVQRMVDADAAGVMFTANPVTGDRSDIVVDASSGLGEAVVSGLVTPDHYVLDRRGRVRERQAGRREVVIRAAADGGVTHDSGAAGAESGLPDSALRELAELGTRVAERFGRPQDIEWAYADGHMRLLQARPMTAVPPPPLRTKLNPLQRRFVPFLAEMLQVRPYPLDMTTWLRDGPLKMVERMIGSVGVRFPAIEEFLPEEDGVVARLEPPNPRPTAAMLLAPASVISRIRRYDPARWTDDPRFGAFVRRVRAQADHDPRTLSWRELSRVPRELSDLMSPITDLRIDYLPWVGLALLRLNAELKLLGRGDLASFLIVGAPTRTGAANRALQDLAEQVRDDPGLSAVFADPPAGGLLDTLRTDPRFDDFHTALQAFLAEYGHRETASPLLVSAPTWGEVPETVLDMIRTLVDAPPVPVSAHRVEQPAAGLAFREDTHFYGTLALPVLRRALLEIGRRLTDAGVLREPDEVFHLRLAEIEGIADADGLTAHDTARLRGTVLARSAKRDELAGVRMIDFAAVYPGDASDTGALLTGTPACGGRVTGPVRIIREAAEFGRLRSGDVLVCPYTNPAWTPLFQRAAAVVVDTGGVASHAAIVAREYGIPAIMGTAEATGTLVDGQVVTVDGDRGRVTATDDPA